MGPGWSPPAEKHPVAGEMCSKTQMPRTLRKARAAAAVEVKINRGWQGALFVKNAQTATPNMHGVPGCARGCAEQPTGRHEDWMSVMMATDDVGGAGRRRQDTDGRRRAEQKLHECVLEQTNPPETAVMQETVTFPRHQPGTDVGQHKEVLDRVRGEWEMRLEAAIKRRPQDMPALVRGLANARATRARQRKRKSVRKTASRVDKQMTTAKGTAE